ncbi:hypothetical protein M9458_054957, partial [Cirrhinus mrigala]
SVPFVRRSKSSAGAVQAQVRAAGGRHHPSGEQGLVRQVPIRHPRLSFKRTVSDDAPRELGSPRKASGRDHRSSSAITPGDLTAFALQFATGLAAPVV